MSNARRLESLALHLLFEKKKKKKKKRSSIPRQILNRNDRGRDGSDRYGHTTPRITQFLQAGCSSAPDNQFPVGSTNLYIGEMRLAHHHIDAFYLSSCQRSSGCPRICTYSCRPSNPFDCGGSLQLVIALRGHWTRMLRRLTGLERKRPRGLIRVMCGVRCTNRIEALDLYGLKAPRRRVTVFLPRREPLFP